MKAKEEFGRMGKQAVETFNNGEFIHGDTINPFNMSKSGKDGICPTITTRPEGFKTAIIVVEDMKIKNGTKKGYLVAEPYDGIDLAFPTSKYRRGRVQKDSIQTLDTSGGTSKGVLMQDYRIRKLTPKECWRLMGCADEDFEKAEEVNSNSQLYKQAGNAIVVDVLERIFENLLRNPEFEEVEE